MRTEVKSKKQNLISAMLMGLFGAAVIFAAGSRAHGEPPTAEDREKFHAAMEACVSETGVSKPEQGQRPSVEDRQKIDSCLASKGIEKPPRPPGKGGRPQGPPPEEAQSSSDSAS